MQLEPLHPIQIQPFRDARLFATRRANPNLNEEECKKLVAREFARART